MAALIVLMRTLQLLLLLAVLDRVAQLLAMEAQAAIAVLSTQLQSPRLAQVKVALQWWRTRR